MMHGKQKSVKKKTTKKKIKDILQGGKLYQNKPFNFQESTTPQSGLQQQLDFQTIKGQIQGGRTPPPPPSREMTYGFLIQLDLFRSPVSYTIPLQCTYPVPTQNSGSAPAITSVFTHLLLSHITTILDKLFNQLHGTNYTAFHNQDSSL